MNSENNKSPTAEDMKQSGLMNFEAAYEGTDSDPELLRMLIELFIRKTPDALVKLEEALAKGDAAAVSLQAHSLKGALRTLVAPKLVELAQKLETLGRENNLGEGTEALDELRALLTEFYGELEGHLRKLDEMGDE